MCRVQLEKWERYSHFWLSDAIFRLFIARKPLLWELHSGPRHRIWLFLVSNTSQHVRWVILNKFDRHMSSTTREMWEIASFCSHLKDSDYIHSLRSVTFGAASGPWHRILLFLVSDTSQHVRRVMLNKFYGHMSSTTREMRKIESFFKKYACGDRSS